LLNSNTPCPKCGQPSFFINDNLVGMPAFMPTENEGEIEVTGRHFFTVRPYFCKLCGYVELKYENPLES
jgi:predicted nucleic-acid-binding Zn-ribbon protein